MKIAHIEIDHLLGIKSADIRVEQPVLVATGRNGAGKSSLQECIRLALLAHSPRVDLKKDYGQLVHRGAKAGMVALNTSDGAISVHVTAEGKVTDSAKGRDSQAFVEYVLDPSFFARDDAASRRKMLFKLLGLDLSADGIQTRLLAKECDSQKVVAIAPILRAGFEAAQKHAANYATQSKGAFRAVTNETWGSSKGATWRAPTPEFSGEQAAELHGLDKAIAEADRDLGDAQKRLGETEHAKQTWEQRAQQIYSLQELAAKLDEHTKLADKSAGELKELEDELQEAREKAGVAPRAKPKLLPCPDCGAALCLQADGTLAEYPTLPEDPPHDRDAAASIPGIEKAIATMRAVVARHTKNRDDAKTAGDNLALLKQQHIGKAPNPQPIQETVATLKTDIAAKRKRQAELQDAHRKLDEADEKTKAARGHHADVLAWDAIAKALSPDGIPAEILSEALAPFNARMATSCGDAQWPLVTLDEDMSIRYGGQPIRHCSESEQYRANAIIAEAISFLSGLRFLCLDRADLLDSQGWSDLMYWADTLAYQKDVDTVLILGTTDGEPTGLTDLMQHVRIEAGQIVQQEQREAA